MNTLKIFSLLIFAFFCFAVSLSFAMGLLKIKEEEKKLPYFSLIHYSSIFLAISIMINLVFQKVSYLYDLIEQYNFDFKELFSTEQYRYGFSPEMVKVTTIYLALSLLWVLLMVWASRGICRYFFFKDLQDKQIYESIVLLALSVAFYPILSFILDNFYVILDRPIIN